MTPAEFFSSLEKRGPAAVYLFIGPDSLGRRRAKASLIEKLLPAADAESGITRLDLDEVSLPAVIDDASSLSLFATNRLIWVSNAEGALPRRLTAKEEEGGPGATLAAYVKNPTPGTVIVFDCQRYGLDGDDAQKLERVRKFYSAIPTQVEFAPLDSASATALVRERAQHEGVGLSPRQAGTIAEALAADAGRIHLEMEKLGLYAKGRDLTDAEIAELVPNARTDSIFNLVNALAKGDRRVALDVLDTLVRDGEYLPLVLTFLATQFRLASAAAEVNARNAGQIQAHFSKLGVSMWRSRAEQLAETLRVFPSSKLKRAVELTYETDRALRDTRPDDRTVMELFVWKLTV
jgi:DNA polymerase-3 subunit delta